MFKLCLSAAAALRTQAQSKTEATVEVMGSCSHDESQNWIRAFEVASPGKYGEMEKFLGGFLGKQNEKEPVIAALTHNKGGRVGIAVLSSFSFSFRIYDFLDDSRYWTDTEACLTQNGVREVLVAESGGAGSKRKAEEAKGDVAGYEGDFQLEK